VDIDNNVFTNPLDQANFTNCIIYGNDNPEFIVDKEESEVFNFKFSNCLIRFNDTSNNFTGPLYDFNDSTLYENIIFNENPEFLDPLLNLLQIPNNSPADGTAFIFGALSTDITSANRGTPPDIGAYESIEFPEE